MYNWIWTLRFQKPIPGLANVSLSFLLCVFLSPSSFWIRCEFSATTPAARPMTCHLAPNAMFVN